MCFQQPTKPTVLERLWPKKQHTVGPQDRDNCIMGEEEPCLQGRWSWGRLGEVGSSVGSRWRGGGREGGQVSCRGSVIKERWVTHRWGGKGRRELLRGRSKGVGVDSGVWEMQMRQKL